MKKYTPEHTVHTHTHSRQSGHVAYAASSLQQLTAPSTHQLNEYTSQFTSLVRPKCEMAGNARVCVCVRVSRVGILFVGGEYKFYPRITHDVLRTLCEVSVIYSCGAYTARSQVCLLNF